MYFDIKGSGVEEYQITHNMFWPIVSYKIYGTTRLAWLLMKLNNVKNDSIFNILHAGDKVKYITQEYLNNIVNTINDENV